MTALPIVGGVAPPPYKSLFHRLAPPKKLKTVLMPQSEYKKDFATDKAGSYIVTEAQWDWTDAELGQRYAKYKSALPHAPMRSGTALNEGGLYCKLWNLLGRLSG